jgi:hypothetical protein
LDDRINAFITALGTRLQSLHAQAPRPVQTC